MDVDSRKSTSGESEPTAPAITSSDRSQFEMGIAGARDYKELLSQGVMRESPGAPIPYSGVSLGGGFGQQTGVMAGEVPAAASQAQSAPVPQGTHTDPMAGWVNDGSVPAGTTGYSGINTIPQGSGAGRSKQFAQGERD